MAFIQLLTQVVFLAKYFIRRLIKHGITVAAVILVLQKILLILAIGVVLTPWDDVFIVMGVSNLLGIPAGFQVFLMIALYAVAIYVVWKWAPNTFRQVKRLFKKWLS